VKLVCYEVNSDGTFNAYDRRSIKIKIGKGLTESGYLSDEANQDTIECLRLFRDILVSDEVKNILAVATSAVRDAKNRIKFISEIMRKPDSHSGFYHTRKNHIIHGVELFIPHVSQTHSSST
jgi:exopolyphosphatase/guanosine-5'-triphosphate,3'-diphosphate pyrophosphatase